MKTLEEVERVTFDKIKFLSEISFILKKDYDEQLQEIKNHFIDACNESKSIVDWDWIEWFKMSNKPDLEIINNAVKQYYKRTNSWLENWWWQNYHNKERLPLIFYYVFSLDEWGKELKEKHNYLWNISKNLSTALNGENLKEVNSFYVNIADNPDKKPSYYYPKYFIDKSSLDKLSEFRIIIYLFSNKRIIRLNIQHDGIDSKENIIQRDIKKIEIINNLYVNIHYHGLHDPDLIIMDNYESAIALRTEISKLREYK